MLSTARRSGSSLVGRELGHNLCRYNAPKAVLWKHTWSPVLLAYKKIDGKRFILVQNLQEFSGIAASSWQASIVSRLAARPSSRQCLLAFIRFALCRSTYRLHQAVWNLDCSGSQSIATMLPFGQEGNHDSRIFMSDEFCVLLTINMCGR